MRPINAKCGSQMRPHIVWFGEMPMQMDEIHDLAEQSSLFVSIGTSGQVYLLPVSFRCLKICANQQSN